MTKPKKQDALLAVKATWLVGNRDEGLYSVARQLRDNLILMPPFQRDYVWPRPKLTEWICTVISQQAVGVIVTYQLKGQGPRYLADGYQRLTSTLRFLDNPAAYGFSFGQEQAQEYCDAFPITMQHRHYKDHWEAMTAFQRVNMGTPATPKEFHKGELTLDPIGLLLWNEIPAIVNSHSAPLLSGRTPGRTQSSKLLRDTFGLFLQYISGTKQVTFWSVGKTNAIGTSVEAGLLKLTRETSWTHEHAKAKMEAFNRFLAAQIAELRTLRDETGQQDKAFSPATLRWLLHLSIWRKNTGSPIELYRQFVSALLELFKPYPRLTSRFALPTRYKGEMVIEDFITLSMDSLGKLKKLSECLQIPLYESNDKRHKQQEAAIGYHASHLLPFSTHGEGETIIEPAPRNLARGAKPISIS